MSSTPAIIEVAMNGALPKRSNPLTPRSPEEVASDGLRCIDAGASILHNHTDDPVIGGSGSHDPEPYRAAWTEILDAHPDVLLYPTMPGGAPGQTIEARYAHIEKLAEWGLLGLGLLDPGTTDLGRFDADGKPRPGEVIYQNTWSDGIYMMETCRRLGVGISVSIFEPGFLRFLLGYAQADALPPGVFVKFYFGGARAGFGLPPSEKALEAYLDMLDGTGLPWLVSVQGGDVVASGLARLALERGGHLQVGLEPSGDRTRGNVALVTQAVELARDVGREPATIGEARGLIGVPA
jgi:3-keto-5-aminohexanoate cleavage enzyme